MKGSLQLSSGQLRALLLSILAGAGAYMAFAIWSGWNDVVSATTLVGLAGIAIALALSLVNYGLRFIRWQIYLGAMRHPVPWLPGLGIYLAGFALTTTPAKAGEALRSLLLKPWSVPFPASLAALLSERLADLLAILLLSFAGFALHAQTSPLTGIGLTLVALLYWFVSRPAHLLQLLHWFRWIPGLPALSRATLLVLQEAGACHRPWLFGLAMLMGCTAWLAEAWALYILLIRLGVDIEAGFVVYVYAVAMLAGALSFLPGGLGSTEAVMIALLVWSGVDTPLAVAATILIRMTTLWFAVLLGLLALVACRKLPWQGHLAGGS